jgi:hypothetical protein
VSHILKFGDAHLPHSYQQNAVPLVDNCCNRIGISVNGSKLLSNGIDIKVNDIFYCIHLLIQIELITKQKDGLITPSSKYITMEESEKLHQVIKQRNGRYL